MWDKINKSRSSVYPSRVACSVIHPTAGDQAWVGEKELEKVCNGTPRKLDFYPLPRRRRYGSSIDLPSSRLFPPKKELHQFLGGALKVRTTTFKVLHTREVTFFFFLHFLGWKEGGIYLDFERIMQLETETRVYSDDEAFSSPFN